MNNYYLCWKENDDMRKFFTLLAALTLAFAAAAQDFDNTYDAITAACKRGDADAFYAMGNAYRWGKDVCPDFPHAKNERAAYNFYRSAANKGHADAMLQLGHMTFYGWGCERDTTKAIEWYKKAANAGNRSAYGRLGDIYTYDLRDTEGAAQKAFGYYKQGALNYEFAAMYGLGTYYLYILKDKSQALIWLARCVDFPTDDDSIEWDNDFDAETAEIAREILAQNGVTKKIDIYNFAEEISEIEQAEAEKYARSEQAAAKRESYEPSAGNIPLGRAIYMRDNSREGYSSVTMLMFNEVSNTFTKLENLILTMDNNMWFQYAYYDQDDDYFYFAACNTYTHAIPSNPKPDIKVRKDWSQVVWRLKDPITGKYNYRYFEDIISKQEFERVRNSSTTSNTTTTTITPTYSTTPSTTPATTSLDTGGMSESFYRDMYSQYEMVAKSAYSSLAGSRWNSSASSSVDYTALQGELRKAQSDMRRVRQEAANAGYHIPQSMYETVTD